MAKVVGSLAARRPDKNRQISGVLVKRNFNYHIMAPTDIPNYTDLTMSRVTQRLSIAFTGTLGQLQYYLGQLSGDVEKLEVNDKPALRVFKAVTITQEPRMVTLEWTANPINDMYADATVTVVLKAETDTAPHRLPSQVVVDRSHFRECLMETLAEMFGQGCVKPLIKGEKLTMLVDDKTIVVDLATLDVTCHEDESLQQIVHTAVTKLHQAITPAKV